MGLFSSKNKENKDIKTLYQRILAIEKAADLDGNGIVTKKELKEYTATQLQIKNGEVLQMQNELRRVREERDRLEKEYNALHKKHDDLLAGKSEAITQAKPIDGLSSTAIEHFVDELLADPNVNIYMLPDKIEKPLYVNIVKMLLGMLQKTFHHTNLNLIGHNIKMHMQAKKEGEST